MSGYALTYRSTVLHYKIIAISRFFKKYEFSCILLFVSLQKENDSPLLHLLNRYKLSSFISHRCLNLSVTYYSEKPNAITFFYELHSSPIKLKVLHVV